MAVGSGEKIGIQPQKGAQLGPLGPDLGCSCTLFGDLLGRGQVLCRKQLESHSSTIVYHSHSIPAYYLRR